MAACLDPHFGYLEANVLRKISDNFMRNVHVDRLETSVHFVSCVTNNTE